MGGGQSRTDLTLHRRRRRAGRGGLRRHGGRPDFPQHGRRRDVGRADAADDARRRDGDRRRSSRSPTPLAGTNSEGIFRSTDGGSDLGPHGRSVEQGNGLVPRDRSDEVLDRVRDDARRALPERGRRRDMEGTAQEPEELERARPRDRSRRIRRRCTPRRPSGSTSRSMPAAHWAMQNPDLYVSALSLDPRAPSVLYAGTHLGVLKSVDAGREVVAAAPRAGSERSAAAVPASSSGRSTAPSKPSMVGRNAPNGASPPDPLRDPEP